MAFMDSSLVLSPPTSSYEDVFVTPLSNRARSTSPRQFLTSPTPQRVASQGRSSPMGIDTADVNEQAETSAFNDDDDDDLNYQFKTVTSFQDASGNPQQFTSRDTAYEYIQAWAKIERFAIKFSTSRKRPDKTTIYKQFYTCVCGGTRANSKAESPQKRRKGRSKHVACK